MGGCRSEGSSSQHLADVSQLADPTRTPFEDAAIQTFQVQSSGSHDDVLDHKSSGRSSRLAASRAYTLSLSPHFLYTRSELISVLISSKVYRQLEFMAVGSWWVYSTGSLDEQKHDGGAMRIFHRVPGNREDIFSDSQISMKSKRTLIRFLRHISKDEEEQDGLAPEDLSGPFTGYLSANFGVPSELHSPLLSLALSQSSQQDTPASFAIPRVKRHLASMGAMGPGFAGVLSKYGGGSEILQVACRASAVGGAVYALDTAIESLTDAAKDEPNGASDHPIELRLSTGETVRSHLVIGSPWDLPIDDQPDCVKVARSITVASSSFDFLFPVTVEGAPVPASAVLMFSGDTLDSPSSPPVYLRVHSSDTGDCPRQQSKCSRFPFASNEPHPPPIPLTRMMIIFNLSTLPDIVDET